jgi:hypothetical protein
MDAFEAYKKYMAVKIHFKNDSYSYFRYGGKVKLTASSFETRKDRYQFHKLAMKFKGNVDDFEIFLASVLRDNPDVWIGNLCDAPTQTAWKHTKKNLMGLKYHFCNEVKQCDSLDDALVVRQGEYPKIFKMFQQKKVSAETLCILNGTLNIFNYWDKTIADEIIWPKIKKSLLKYGEFLNSRYDKEEYNTILKQLF